MKTFSKDDVINAIRDLLQNVTEVESKDLRYRLVSRNLKHKRLQLC